MIVETSAFTTPEIFFKRPVTALASMDRYPGSLAVMMGAALLFSNACGLSPVQNSGGNMISSPERTIIVRWLSVVLCVGPLSVVASSWAAQLIQPRQPMPSFEVVSVRPWTPNTVTSPSDGGSPKKAKVMPASVAQSVSDRIRFIGQIELLIENAYGFPFSSSKRIVGGPEWVRSESDRYEVIAKIDDKDYAAIKEMAPRKQQEEVSLMEQSLLADRFKFRGHIENRTLPRFALVLARGGSKLQRAQEDAKRQLSLVRDGQENELRATAVSIGELAESPFIRIDDRQVVDRTGLQGKFTFTLKFRPAGSEDDGSAPELTTALQQQIGLRLVPEDGEVQVVVIDHIERPSGN
jgi:bla regulator protein BlaR1